MILFQSFFNLGGSFSDFFGSLEVWKFDDFIPKFLQLRWKFFRLLWKFGSLEVWKIDDFIPKFLQLRWKFYVTLVD